MTGVAGTLHEDKYTFFFISCSIWCLSDRAS